MNIYYYTALRDTDKSTLQINNKQDNILYDIDYFKKRVFKKKQQEIQQFVDNTDVVNTLQMECVGFTSLKRTDTEDQTDSVFEAANSEYIIHNKKPFMHRIKGYIPAIPELDVVSYDNRRGVLQSNAAQPKYLAYTKFSLLPLLPLLLLVLVLMFFIFDKNNTEITPNASDITSTPFTEQYSESTTKPKMPIDEDATPWTGPSPSDNAESGSSGEIEIVGLNEVTISSDNTDIQFINPSGNQVYFKFEILDPNTKKLLDSTDLIPPGSYVNWNAKSMLYPGEYDVPILLSTYSIATGEQRNGANIVMHVIVK